MRHLDLSNNNIESKGFAKLLDALGESSQITYLNVAENDMSLYQEHFESLTQFLKKNTSLQTLKMNKCGISTSAM
jgi:hypothetical protein